MNISLCSFYRKCHRASVVLASIAALLFFTGVMAAGPSSNQIFNPQITKIFISGAAYDGWILETSPGSGQGGITDPNAAALIVGDDAKNRQYRSILSFNTQSLPDNIFISAAQVTLTKQGFVGNAVTGGLNRLQLVIKNSAYGGHVTLQPEDFSDKPSTDLPIFVSPTLDPHKYAGDLSKPHFEFISTMGVTQFRLHFESPTNTNSSPDYIKFFSGSATDENVPLLSVTYCVGPAAPTLLFPPDNAVMFAGGIDFKWNPVSNATEYYFEYMDASGKSLGNSDWISATNYPVTLPAGKYQWHVTTRNADGACLWSDTWNLTVSDPPVLTFPPNEAVVFAGPIDFKWEPVLENIPVSGATQYYLEYSGTSSGSCGPVNVPTCSVNLTAGDYTWSVRASNDISNSSLRSPAWNLKVSDPPGMVSPPDTAVVFAGTIDFKWNPVPENIPVSGATQYYLEYSGTSSGSCGPVNVPTCSVNLTAGDYTWSVRASNAISNSALRSPAWNLKVSDPPELDSPKDGAVVFAGMTTFTWKPVPENVPVSGTTQYCFAYDDGNCDISSAKTSGWIGATTYSTPLTFGKYTWHVKAKNDISMSDWGGRWSITVSDPPTLISPADNDHTLVGPINFTWNAVNGATEYQFEYIKSDGTTSNSGWISTTNKIVFDTSLINPPNYNSCDKTKTKDIKLAPRYDAGPHYWRVKARNANSESDWSARWQFWNVRDMFWTNDPICSNYPPYYLGYLDNTYPQTQALFSTGLVLNTTLSVQTSGNLSVSMSLLDPSGATIGIDGPGTSPKVYKNNLPNITGDYKAVIMYFSGSGNYKLCLTYTGSCTP